MNQVYVIYRNGEMYKNDKRKIAYLCEKSAKAVVTSVVKEIARDSNIYWYDMTKEEQTNLLNEIRSEFEIKIYVPKVGD